MGQKIRINCTCGKVLSINYEPGMKFATCPECGKKYGFKPVEKSEPQGETPTQIDMPSYQNTIVGVLRNKADGTEIKLRKGKNILGRKSPQSQATIQIDTAENRLLSREHLVIEVKDEAKFGITHYLKLYKERVNKTLHNNEVLNYPDESILNDGDTVTLPGGITLTFEIPDSDRTVIG